MAKHSSAVGKERILPDMGNGVDCRARIKSAMLRKIPKNLIYQNAPCIDGKFQEDRADVYRCSDVENMAYYYMEVLTEVPDLFSELISDEKLFDSSGEHVVHKECDISDR